jgi:hypothetical protein
MPEPKRKILSKSLLPAMQNSIFIPPFIHKGRGRSSGFLRDASEVIFQGNINVITLWRYGLDNKAGYPHEGGAIHPGRLWITSLKIIFKRLLFRN